MTNPQHTTKTETPDENTEKERRELAPAALSNVAEWTPELVIIVVCLAFAGAFQWPLLALGALLAALRIIGERTYREWANARVRRRCAAERAAKEAHLAADDEVVVVDQVLTNGGETR